MAELGKEKVDGATSLLLLVLLAANISLDPVVIKLLWNWYVVPLGAPAMHWLNAFGLNLIVYVLTWKWTGERTTDEAIKAGINCVAATVFALVLGWLGLRLLS